MLTRVAPTHDGDPVRGDNPAGAGTAATVAKTCVIHKRGQTPSNPPARLPSAETELRTAAEMFRAAGATFYAVQVEVGLADVRWRLGHSAEAESLLTTLLEGLAFCCS